MSGRVSAACSCNDSTRPSSRSSTPTSLTTVSPGSRKVLGARGVQYVHAILRHSLRDAVEWGRIVRNPCDVARPPRPKEAKTKMMTTWKPAEIRRFFADPSVREHPDRVAWFVAVMSGLRRGELLALRWRDVDLDAGQLTIVQTLQVVGNDTIVVPGTKTGRGRSVSIDEGTVAEFARPPNEAHQRRPSRREATCRYGVRVREA